MTNNHNLCRRRRIYASWLLFLSLSLTLSAQDLLVSGQVTDGQLPISGANVLIKNTNTGVVSDFDGRYTITAKPSDSLQISYLGYTTLTIPIQNRSTINVTLQEDATALGEVQINAGYYTTTDREKTGSIARITAKEIEGLPVVNPMQTLQGRMPGVDVTQNSGVPGSGITLRIRGQNSIAAGNAPLYIVDGVPYDTNTMGFKNLSGTIMPGGDISPLNTIDANAIQSIEVLKDADATAIYGSRGASGVILITTKKGIAGKTSVNFKTYTGVGKITKFQKLLDTKQYLQLRDEALVNDGFTTYPYNAYDLNGTWERDRYTNWQKEFLGSTAFYHNYQLVARGGNDKTQFTLGGSFMKEGTVFPFDYGYNKTNVFNTLNHSSNNTKFNVQFTASYGIDANRLPGSDLTSISKTLAPNAPALYDDEGNLNWQNSSWTNPYANLEKNYDNSSNNLISNAILSYKIMDELSIKTNMGYSHSQLTETATNPHTVYNPAYGFDSRMSSTFKNSSERNSWIIEPQLDASYDLGNDRLNVILGSSFQNKSSYQLVQEGSGYPNNYFIDNLNAANRVYVTSESSTSYRYMAFYGRLNYKVNQRYILNLTGRRDGSSRFGPGKRFANFGAIGAAWILSEENSFKKIGWLDFAKIRASFGTSGNDQIGDHQYLNTYSISTVNYGNYLGLLPTRLYNPNFAWEVNKKFEVAMESSLLDNRMRLEMAYYRNRSGNQLLGIPLPGTTGFNSIQSNLDATVENAGVELVIASENIRLKNLTWNTSFNLSVPKNRLVSFKGLENSTYANQLVIGEPITILKLYHMTGVDPEIGNFTFEDYNNDGTIDAPGDRQFLVDLSPKFYGGLSNTLRYLNWNLDILFQFVKKQGYNEFYTRSQPVGALSNQPASVLNHWQKPGDQTTYQQFTTGANYGANFAYSRFAASNGIISDASFIRLKTLSLSYNLPVNKSGLDAMRISIQGYNLFTFTNFKGGDPEQLTSFLPPLTKLTLGLDITF